MDIVWVMTILKAMMPVLEPIGEEGIAELFNILTADVVIMPNGPFKDLFVLELPALKAYALLELRKLAKS